MPADAVVITAAAAITPLGLTAEQTWRGVLDRQNALGPMPALEQPSPDGRGGYQCPDLPADFEPGLTREARYLRRVILDALGLAGPPANRGPQAGRLNGIPRDRCGIVLGTTLHGMRSGGAFLRTGDFAHLRHFLAGSVVREATAGLPIGGDAVTTCSACSSSLGSVALAVTLLQTGQLDLVIAGGYDAVSEYAYGGFHALRLVTEGPPRPFSRDRRGMKLGEGYAAVVLRRAADVTGPVMATVAGWGESADAHHLTAPHPQGRGAAMAINAALARAGDELVDLVAAHATATPDNDAGEAAAIVAVFGERVPPVVALKSHLGHTLGAAGAVELVLSALALRDGVIPPTAHTAAADVEYPALPVTVGAPCSAIVQRTLNTSLGFGGANTAVVLDRARPVRFSGREFPPPEADGPRTVYITGVGVLRSPTEAELLTWLNARKVRRLSDYAKLTLAATAMALRDAGYAQGVPPDTAVLLGTAHGSSAYAVDYYRGLIEHGLGLANPMLFAEGVPNAAAAHVSLTHGLTGACQTLIGSRTAGLDAVRLATLRIANGDWDRAIVGAAEEQSDLVDAAYAAAGHPVATVAGAVTLILESRRPAVSRGVIAATAAASGPGAIRSVLRRLGRGKVGEAGLFAVGSVAMLAGGPATVVATGYDRTAVGVSIGTD